MAKAGALPAVLCWPCQEILSRATGAQMHRPAGYPLMTLHEEFGLGVGLSEEAGNGGFMVGDGSEHATAEAPSRDLGNEAFDGIEPGCGGRCEVERPTRMLREPFAHFGRL
jgi:hypothetical protein